MQIANTGCARLTITLSNPCSCKYFIAEEASPTPGKRTLSDCDNTSGESLTTGVTPNRRNAHSTEYTFPALYFMIETFINYKIATFIFANINIYLHFQKLY